MQPPYVYHPERGLRNLLLGRVLLKEDLSAGTSILPVGSEFSDNLVGANIPGACLFYNYSSKATLVQPGSSDTPDDIEHLEDVTLVSVAANDLHVTSDAPVTKDYTVERGAYLQLKTRPAVCSKLKFVERDFTDSLEVQFPDDKFPAAVVFQYNSERRPHSSTTYEDLFYFVVRYGVIMAPTWRDTLRQDIEDLAALISADPYLGGTCWYAEMTKPCQLNPTPGRNAQGMVKTTHDHRVDWGDIYITAHRLAVVDKISNFA